MVKYKTMVRKKARAMYLIGGENGAISIQEGMIGLIKAVRDFSPSQGASFASFAELCVSRADVYGNRGIQEKKAYAA